MRNRRRSQKRTCLVEALEVRCLMATIDLASLTTAQGITLFGVDAGDESGFAVSRAGDVNRDGFDDWIVGAPRANGSGNAISNAGESYLIFGSPTLAPVIQLANVGTLVPGTKFFGTNVDDYSGMSVSQAGDVNGDGFQDLLIGAYQGDAASNAKAEAGESYLIFGGSSLAPTINLSTVGTTTPGIQFFGADVEDYSGNVVSKAGDINGDGFDDLLIGAYKADAAGNAKASAGETYLVFGGTTLPSTIDLNVIGTTVAGSKIFGAETDDYSGRSVSAVGDFNGDGFDDFAISAPYADGLANAENLAGECYLLFGGLTIPPTIDLTTVGTTTPGILFLGSRTEDYTGRSVSGAGDINGDGFDDLLIGAHFGDALNNTKFNAGDSFLIFGRAASPASIDLANTGGSVPGVKFYGTDALDASGFSVSNAGDFNGDGFDDLLLGAYSADGASNLKSNSGESYLVFGGASMPSSIDQTNIGTSVPGLVLFGVDIDDFSGRSVSGAGDVNGDGFSDFLIGASRADGSLNTKFYAGESYLLYGSNLTLSVTHQGTSASETLTGSTGINIMVGGLGNDFLIGQGGADVLTGGQGNDVLAIGDLAFKRVVGGTGDDTLRIDGSGVSLDLTTIRDNRILDIEAIDIAGSGNNLLTLNLREVLNISGESNTLVVRRNAGDVVNIGSGWTQILNQTIGPDTFNVYTQGEARLLVQTTAPDTAPPTVAAIIATGSAWSPAFIDSVDGGGTGAGNGLGYALTSNLTLPNSGIDRLYVQFSEPVVGFNASRLQLLGVNVANYSTTPSFLTVSYDSTNMRGVIQFASPITKDKLRIGVSDAVTDVASIALDGDANAIAGGVLNFRFNILVGDANNDGSVNGGDLPAFSGSFNNSAGAVGFNPRANWNSDDSVNGGDLPLFASNFNQSLPGAEPGSLAFPPPPPPPLLENDDEEASYATLIDDYFREFDQEEERLQFEV